MALGKAARKLAPIAPSAPTTPSTTATHSPDPVDQVPPLGKMAVLGFQHVLAFYAGAVVVPLVIASGLNLDAATTVHLINADLLTCGIATIIQSAGLGPKIGVRLPLIQGVTFTAVSPLIAIGLAASGGAGGVEGLSAMYGSIIVAGLATFLAAPYFARLLRFFPPVVTGTLLTVMGLTLMSVSANDIMAWGNAATQAGQDPSGAIAKSLGYAGLTLALIVLIQKVFKGFMATISVLVALVTSTCVAWALGDTDFSGVADASAFAVTTPFYFGMPTFTVAGIVSMLIVMAVTAVETTGDVFATGEVVGKRIAPGHVANALRADGLSTLLGGILNSFPYTCFAQNVGLVRLTQVKSRWVVTCAGVFMIILGLLPKAAAVVAAIPSPVIGGASLAMFASVAVVGIQTLGSVDMRDARNAAIVSTSVGLAMLVTFQSGITAAMPSWLAIIFGSGVTIGALSAVLLNLLFFHVGRGSSEDVAMRGGQPLSLEEVGAMDRETFVEVFSGLYDGAAWPAELAWEARPFASVGKLRQAFEDAVLSASPEQQEALLAGYVDIAELLLDGEAGAAVRTEAAGRTQAAERTAVQGAQAATQTADSSEQSTNQGTPPATHTAHGSDRAAGQGAPSVQAQLDTASLALGTFDDVESAELRALSEKYRETFGRPLIMSVDRMSDRGQLLARGWSRLEHSPAREARTALGEVIDIADARFDAMIADANPIRSAWARSFEQLS